MIHKAALGLSVTCSWLHGCDMTRQMRQIDHPVPLIRVRGPEDLIDVVPYLIGFAPRASLVLVALREPRDQVGLTARVDLADLQTDTALLDRCLAAVRRSGSDSVVALVYDESARADSGGPVPDDWHASALPHVGVIADLATACDRLDIALPEAILVGQDRWWSYLCDAAQCCPAEGNHRTQAPSQAKVAAVFAGLQVLPDRQTLIAELEPEPADDRERLLPSLDNCCLDHTYGGAAAAREDRGATRALFAAARARRIAEGVGEQPAPLDDSLLVRFGAALRSISVRDACWLAIDDARLPESRLWIELARRLPAPYDAAPLFLYGWSQWRQGSGTLAAEAASRALASDPGYRAAVLLGEAVTGGLDPTRTPRLGKRGR
jgi:hypothetical protein